MRPIAPKFRDDVDWIREACFAENQPQYLPVYAAIVTHEDGSKSVYTRWTFTDEERARIAAGEDIYFRSPGGLAPHNLMLRPDWADTP